MEYYIYQSIKGVDYMAFYPLHELKKGKYEFLFKMTESDYRRVIEDVRLSSDKINIINGFLNNSKDVIPFFCFDIIYDIDEYKDVTLELLENRQIFDSLVSSLDKIVNILYKTSWGKDFVFQNIDIMCEKGEDILSAVLSYVFNNFDSCQNFIKKLYLHPNLHVRFIFMRYLVVNYPEKVNLIYDDITKYLTSYTHQEYEQMTFLPELMVAEDINALSNLIYDKLDKETWNKIKEHILNNYSNNSLAYFLLNSSYRCKEKLDDFKADSDRFFETSCDYKIEIYRNYSHLVSEELITNFAKYLKYFNSKDGKLENIIQYGLWSEITKYIDKYLSLSNNDVCKPLGSGSTASCYRIGDYTFKLIKKKWSYEDEICPSLYLILKNLEQHYIRDEKGIVLAGLEVQKYLSRKLPIDNPETVKEDIERFKKQLEMEGYYLYDTVVGGMHGDNCMLLDSYKDADCKDPESLPEEFKKKPLVLIDRDLVFKTNNQNRKSLLCWGY